MPNPDDNARQDSTGQDSDKPTDYLVGVAAISFEGLFYGTDMAEAVSLSWHPGHSRQLYGRRWTITKVIESSGGDYFGKIGFVRTDDINTVSFDRDENDFVQGHTSSGAVVPFLISGHQIAYQLVPGAVRESTFIRAFTELMNSAQGNPVIWNLTPLSVETSYDSWAEGIDRITKFDFRLDPPNPHYGQDVIIEALVEGTNAEYVRLVGSAAKGQAIDTNSDPFQQALDHVSKDYGRATLTGLDDRNNETVWTKAKREVARTLARFRITERGGSEAPQVALKSALLQLPTQALPVHIDESDDESIA